MGAEPAPSAPAPRARAAQPPAIPQPVAAQHPASKSQNMRVAGWICFGVGMALLVLCPIIPLYSPFFLVSFVLAVVLLVREEGRGGLALLLTTLLVPTAVGGVIFMLGVGAMMAAFTGFAKDVENSQKTLVAQQQAALNQLVGQQQTLARPAAPQATPPRPMFFQTPSTPAQQPPVARPLPAKEISYDGLLTLLNRFGVEFKAATTTAQKQDVRTRAQRAAGNFVDNARVTLAGTVTDIQYGTDGAAALSVGSFSSPEYDKLGQKTLLFIPATGRLKVPMTREAALAVRSGQKVWVTGRLQVAPTTTMTAGFGEIASPSLLFIQFRDDINMLLTLRVVDYTVSFEEKRSQAGHSTKKRNYLVVGPPKADP
ncbi:MAG: hypothetical protein GX565_08765 [Lentisphaerae bacterium]|nr:hypothetical protein [Lentisphaerota bacterium]